MEAAPDRQRWLSDDRVTSLPTPFPSGEGGLNALVTIPPPPPPRPEPERSRGRYLVPALLLAGWGGLFAYCSAYLREDLPFRPLSDAETARRSEEPPRKVVTLPDLPAEPPPVTAADETVPPAVTTTAALPAVAASVPKRPMPVVEYAGLWGPTAAACLSPSRRRGYLPATITADRARAGRTLCTFHDGHRTGNTWSMAADCSERGRRWSSQVRLLVEGDRLTWTSNRGTATYVRCGRRAG